MERRSKDTPAVPDRAMVSAMVPESGTSSRRCSSQAWKDGVGMEYVPPSRGDLGGVVVGLGRERRAVAKVDGGASRKDVLPELNLQRPPDAQ